jgi:Cellulase (glycosyl hydrolase family 5)
MRKLSRGFHSLCWGIIASVLLLSACSRPAPAKPIPSQPTTAATIKGILGGTATPDSLKPTPMPLVWQCSLRVNGNALNTPNGKHVNLHGANLPTLTEMENSGYHADARLRDLAGANARVVRLTVDLKEVTPTFVPGEVMPFVQQANDLGMIVILAWSATITDPIDDMVDDAEAWVRLEITYLNNNPGVWFDLYSGTQDVTPQRQRSIAQRLVDVARGFRSNNIILVNDPAWLSLADSNANKPLSGGNIVYGLSSLSIVTATLSANKNATRLPFIVTRWGNPSVPISIDLDRLKPLDIGTIVVSDLVDTPHIPAYLADFWQSVKVNWSSCRK